MYENLTEKNYNAIANIENKFVGERIFIIGSGPSLLDTNFDSIKNEILFGVNRLFLGYEEFGINCKFYAASDPNIDYLPNILNLDTCLFLGHGALDNYIKNIMLKDIKVNKNPLLLPLLGWMWEKDGKFSKNLTRGTFNGWTIICDIPLQAAYYMGFEEVYLLGCDWDFSKQSHFYDTKTNTNDPLFYERSFKSYKVCKKVYEDDGRKIINVTPNTKLDVFERSTLEEII